MCSSFASGKRLPIRAELAKCPNRSASQVQDEALTMETSASKFVLPKVFLAIALIEKLAPLDDSRCANLVDAESM